MSKHDATNHTIYVPCSDGMVYTVTLRVESLYGTCYGELYRSLSQSDAEEGIYTVLASLEYDMDAGAYQWGGGWYITAGIEQEIEEATHRYFEHHAQNKERAEKKFWRDFAKDFKGCEITGIEPPTSAERAEGLLFTLSLTKGMGQYASGTFLRVYKTDNERGFRYEVA